jgi:hypothetical protein
MGVQVVIPFENSLSWLNGICAMLGRQSGRPASDLLVKHAAAEVYTGAADENQVWGLDQWTSILVGFPTEGAVAVSQSTLRLH